jgi:hypothetical protein
MGLPRAGMVIEAKLPMVVGSLPPASNDAFLDAAMRWDWVLNFLHPKILCSFSPSN